jgi:hypothetical protein
MGSAGVVVPGTDADGGWTDGGLAGVATSAMVGVIAVVGALGAAAGWADGDVVREATSATLRGVATFSLVVGVGEPSVGRAERARVSVVGVCVGAAGGSTEGVLAGDTTSATVGGVAVP